MQEEEAYRQAYEAAKSRREMEEAWQAQQYLYGNTPEDDEESIEEAEVVIEPVYRVMQGHYEQFSIAKTTKQHQE